MGSDLKRIESKLSAGDGDGEDVEDEKAVLISCLYRAKMPQTLPSHKFTGSQATSRFTQATQSSSMHNTHKPSHIVFQNNNSSKSAYMITTVSFCPSKRRLYIGAQSGELSFWALSSVGGGASSRKVIITQVGVVSVICVPQASDGSLLGKAGLILSGSASGNIGIYEYHGRVAHEPTVSCQTLYSNGGTITGIECYAAHILSTSTDGTLRVWRNVEGRQNLQYPWYEQQQLLLSSDGWLRSMSFGRDEADDTSGTFFVSNDGGSVFKVIPSCIVHDDGAKLIKNQIFTTSTFLGAPIEDLSRQTQDRGIISLKYVPAWKVIFTISYDHCIRGYDVVVGAMKWEWENEGRCPFAALEVDLEHSEVLAVDVQGLLSIFSIRTGSLFATKRLFPNHQPNQKVIAIHRVERQRFAVTREIDVSVWEVNHDLDYNILRGGHEKAVISLYACSGGVGANEGEKDYRIFSASVDNTIRLWDWFDMACVRILEHTPPKSNIQSPNSSEISSMTFYEAWRILVTGHENGDLRLWDLDTGRSRLMDAQHSNSISCLTMAILRKNEELLITGGFDGWVVVWDIRHVRGEPPHMITKFKAHGQGSPDSPGVGGAEKPAGGSEPSAMNLVSISPPEIICILYDAAKKVIFTGGNDGLIKVWSIHGYSLRGIHQGHMGAVTCLALDSNFLFSGSDDCEIKVWDAVPADSSVKPSSIHPSSDHQDRGPLHTPPVTAPAFFSNSKPLSVLSGHTNSISAIQVLWGWGRGGQVLSCSLDGSLRLWDYVAGSQVHKFIAPGSEELRCMAVRADKPEVLVGVSNGNILRFPLPPNAGLDETPDLGVEDDALAEDMVEEEEDEEDIVTSDDAADDREESHNIDQGSSLTPGDENEEDNLMKSFEATPKIRSKESIGLQLVKLKLPTATAMRSRGGPRIGHD